MSLFSILLKENHFDDDQNLKDLKKIDRDRIVYAKLKRKAEGNKHFERLASGSARLVYKFKDKFVAKVAKNSKGIAQNEVECGIGTDHENFTGGIVTKVFYCAENYSFLIAEYARTMKTSDFKRITGIEWKTFKEYIKYLQEYNAPHVFRWVSSSLTDQEVEEIHETEFGSAFHDLLLNYDLTETSGDFLRPSSYGVVKRDYGEDIVITDYGLTREVYNKHYR